VSITIISQLSIADPFSQTEGEAMVASVVRALPLLFVATPTTACIELLQALTEYMHSITYKSLCVIYIHVQCTILYNCAILLIYLHVYN